MFFFAKRNLRGLHENRFSAYRNECQKQRISNSAWCSPSARNYPSLFLCLSSCNTDGEECVSVTLPLGWGEGARFQKEKNIFSHMFIWKYNFFKDHSACINMIPCEFGAHGVEGEGRVSWVPKWSPHPLTAAVRLPWKPSCLKMSFHLPQGLPFSSTHRVTWWGHCSQSGGKHLSRELWARNVHLWGWVCKKCNSLAPHDCYTGKILSSCVWYALRLLPPRLREWSSSLLPGCKKILQVSWLMLPTSSWVPSPVHKTKGSFSSFSE